MRNAFVDRSVMDAPFTAGFEHFILRQTLSFSRAEVSIHACTYARSVAEPT